MRVLHVTDTYLPTVGGIELHVRDLVTHQRAAGLDARVLTPSPAGLHRDPEWVVRGGRSRAGDGWDVVHAHLSVWSPFTARTLRRFAEAGVPAVATVHSLWSPYHGLPRLAAGLAGVGRWPVVWSAVSGRAARDVRAALDVEVQVLPNAVTPEEWQQPRRDRAGRGPALTVVTVGRLAWTKRSLALVPILAGLRARVPDHVPLRAEIVGDGPQRAALERLVRRAGLDWVDLVGATGRTEIRDRLAAADLYLAPAELESFGIAALEARSAGLPVVAHRRSGVGEFVTDGVDGLLVDDDDGFADALATLVNDDALRGRIADHNHRIRPHCDWAAACSGAERLYRMAGARPTRPAGMPS